MSNAVHSNFSPVSVTPIASTTATSIATITNESDLSSDPATTSDEITTTCGPIQRDHSPRPAKDSTIEIFHYDEFTDIALGQSTTDHYERVYANSLASSVSEKLLASYETGNYNSLACAERCDRTVGCKAFNIFFERTPAMNLREGCHDSPSSTRIKCCLSENRLNDEGVTDQRYSLYDIEVTIAGSNAYNKKGRGSDDEDRPAESIAPILVVSVSVVVVFVALTSTAVFKYCY